MEKPTATKLRTHFISGLMVTAPLFLTLIFINYLVRLMDVFVVNPVFRLLPLHDLDATFKIVLAKLAIAACVLLFITLSGIAAEKLVFRQMMVFGESLLRSIPLFNKVYGSIREIAQAFFGDRRGVFRKVVFIEYPRKGLYSVGFVTQDKAWEINEKTGRETWAVFMPHPPNPASGFLVFVPREEIIESELSIEDGVKLIISGGAAVPPRKNHVS